MPRLLQPLWLWLATATDTELKRMVEYLKAENRILRDKLPARLTVTPRERNRLVPLGAKLDPAIKDLITIVCPRTFARWVAATTPPDPAANPDTPSTEPDTPARKPGRPRTADDIRALILKLARENGWGYTRILGELKKLGITSVGRTTVADLLRQEGLDPRPKRGSGSWDEFLKRHAATLWACDFLSVKSATLTGFVDLYILAFIHLGSRQVIVSGPTANPDAKWVTQQARNASATMADWGLPASHLLLDHDTTFTTSFDAVFEPDGTEVKRVGPMAPNLNAYIERFVQTIKTECLDHFLVCGEKHLRHILKEFVAHYHEERPHQGVGNVPLTDADDEPQTLPCPKGPVVCRERLGGLLKHYSRRAA